MIIKEIKKYKKSLTVIFDDGSKKSLYPGVYAEFNLYKGKEISDKLFNEMLEYNKVEEYFSYCLKKLTLNEYSPQKIKDLLTKKGASKNEISRTLEKLRKYDFINEEKIVQTIVDRCDRRHLGYNKIISMLKDRQISEKEISKIKYNLKREENEVKIQAQVLVRKYKNKSASETKKAVYQGLIRNGFDEELSREILGSLITYNHIHEINVLKLDYQKYFLKYSIKYQGYELESRITETLLRKGYRNEDIKEISNEMD